MKKKYILFIIIIFIAILLIIKVGDSVKAEKNNDVEIAALTLPKANAKSTALKLVSLGVHAIWNFAHVDLDDIPDVVIENVHLSDSLMQLSYNITKQK